MKENLKKREVIVRISKRVITPLLGCTDLGKGWFIAEYFGEQDGNYRFLDIEDNPIIIPKEWVVWMAPAQYIILEGLNDTGSNCQWPS